MSAPARRLRICVVSSVGGHLREVLDLVQTFGTAEVRFLVNDAVQVSLPGPVEQIAHAERDARVLWNAVEAAESFSRHRPDVLLSTGAGPIVPLSIVGKLYRAQTIYIETFGSVDKPSLTGTLMEPLADRLYYQWPQLAPHFPRGRYAGPIFVPQPATRPDDGSLFVAVGTSQRGFDRLMRWIDALARQNALPGPVEAQTGITLNYPSIFKHYPQLSSDVLEQKLAAAKVVICHAGAGIVGTCLRLGKRPIVVPRLAHYNEAINDHQLMLATALAQAGQAIVVTDEAQLRPAIASAWSGPPLATSPAKHRLHDAIAADLQEIAARRSLSI